MRAVVTGVTAGECCISVTDATRLSPDEPYVAVTRIRRSPADVEPTPSPFAPLRSTPPLCSRSRSEDKSDIGSPLAAATTRKEKSSS
jgi:hypothetical protein